MAATGPLTRAVTFEFHHDDDDLEMTPWFFSPSTLCSPHTFIMQPGDRVLILFNSHDLLFRFRACCGTHSAIANEQLAVVIANTNQLHRIAINRHATLAEIFMQPGIEHRLVVGTISELADYSKEVEQITFDQLNQELDTTWTVGETVRMGRRPPLKNRIFSALKEETPLEMASRTPFWLKNPRLWRRAGGDDKEVVIQIGDENKEKEEEGVKETIVEV